MRVVHFSSVHPWNDIRIFHKMCKSLAALGIETHLIATDPSRKEKELIDGVFIHPVPAPKNRLERMVSLANLVTKHASLIPADIYHFHDPELLPFGLRLQRLLRKPVVYDVHENYRVHTSQKEWLPLGTRYVVERLVGLIEDFTCKRLAGVVSATPSIAGNFSTHKVSYVVQNFPILNEFKSVRQKYSERFCKPTFCYVGFISAIRGIREMILAMGKLKNDAELHLAGEWDSHQLRNECRALPGWSKVRELGVIDRLGVECLLSQSLGGIVVFQPLRNHVTAQPNKMFEYMSASVAVVASDFPLWREIVEKNSCGVLVDCQSPDSIAGALDMLIQNREFADQLGKNGRSAVELKYNWEVEFTKLISMYQRLVRSV